MLREGERVTSLELFFDLVFVLALTQCTALMAATPTWEGLLKALLVLGVLWWSWVGYAWLTSVVDPEEGSVRLVMFAAMAALLVAALCVPGAFGGDALLFACAYGVVRAAHIGLFVLASRDDAALRRSVLGLALSTAVGVGLLFAAAARVGRAAARALGARAGARRGRAVPVRRRGLEARSGSLRRAPRGDHHHRAGRVRSSRSAPAPAAAWPIGVVAAAVLGIVVVGALWWLYFDIVAIVAQRRLSKAAEGRERNEIARDSYSYLHFPMVAGIALVAVGMKKTLAHVDDPLGIVPAAAMLGGTAMYLLAHVAFRWRNIHRFSPQRLICAGLALAAARGGGASETAVAAHARRCSPRCSRGLIVYEVAALRRAARSHPPPDAREAVPIR